VTVSDFHSKYFTLDRDGDVVIASFTQSNLSDEENIELLGRELFRLIDDDTCRNLILCMGIVEYLTSALLGKLITLHRRLHRSNGRLVLCQLQDCVAEIMHKSRLLDYFNTADDLDAAVAVLKR